MSTTASPKAAQKEGTKSKSGSAPLHREWSWVEISVSGATAPAFVPTSVAASFRPLGDAALASVSLPDAVRAIGRDASDAMAAQRKRQRDIERAGGYAVIDGETVPVQELRRIYEAAEKGEGTMTFAQWMALQNALSARSPSRVLPTLPAFVKGAPEGMIAELARKRSEQLAAQQLQRKKRAEDKRAKLAAASCSSESAAGCDDVVSSSEEEDGDEDDFEEEDGVEEVSSDEDEEAVKRPRVSIAKSIAAKALAKVAAAAPAEKRARTKAPAAAAPARKRTKTMGDTISPEDEASSETASAK